MNVNRNILLSFDLDFTLVNNQEGIIKSFNYALNRYNLSQLEGSEILPMIGLPLAEMFQKVTDLDPDILVNAFREYYKSHGIYQVEFLPGVREKLQELKDNLFTLGIITSKKQEMAKKVIEILNISHFFEYIIGDGDIMKTKTDQKLIDYLKTKYANYDFIIVGDHIKDRFLAENLNVPFIGVLTGTHSAEELRSNSSTKTLILPSVKDLSPNLIYSLV
ncbi:MAG: HAD family hydrolase [Candidatus Hermodarchaeota archaeon]